MPNSDYLIFMFYVNTWMSRMLAARRAAAQGSWGECGTLLDIALVYLRHALSMLYGKYSSLDTRLNILEKTEPPRLTDAQIFDACYRELVRRWGSPTE